MLNEEYANMHEFGFMRMSSGRPGNEATLEPLFVLKILSRTQRATEVKTFFSAPRALHLVHCWCAEVWGAICLKRRWRFMATFGKIIG